MKIQVSLSVGGGSIVRASALKISPAKIPKLILSLIVEFDMKPKEINKGWCFEFARRLHDMVGGTWLEYESTGFHYLNHHAWLYAAGKHYDAECPNGVSEYTELPCFKKGKIA